MTDPVTITILEHDPHDAPLLLLDWLQEQTLRDKGIAVDLRRLHAGDELPHVTELQGLISLGGEMAAWDDEVAPWLPATRRLLAETVARRIPTFGICLGAQLLAAATGGTVTKGPDGPELGAYLGARRDSADSDPLFHDVPLTPDMMHYHEDVIAALPPGGVLLISSPGYPHQAFRVGQAAWGTQFHFEAPAEVVRQWGRNNGLDIEAMRRFGPMLDEAEETVAVVWRDVMHRFAEQVLEHAGVAAADPLLGRRLPLNGDR